MDSTGCFSLSSIVVALTGLSIERQPGMGIEHGLVEIQRCLWDALKKKKKHSETEATQYHIPAVNVCVSWCRLEAM